jgi:hypothetical protein
LAQAAYCAVVALLAGVASALGVFARGDGSFQSVTSVRGVTYEMATSGVYAYNSQQVVAEGVGWDVFTLVVTVPAMVIAALFVARGSYRGRLIALGMFGYFLYLYLEYAMTWAFGPLFPLLIVLMAASLGGLVWLGVSVGREGVSGRFGADFPRRAFAAINITMAALLSVMWIGRIAAGLGGDLVGAGIAGETTLVVQALDLGFVVPTSLFISFLVLRRNEAGYALAAVYTVTAIAMSAAIVSMLVSASIVNGEAQLPPITIFGLFTLLNVLIGLRIYRGVRETTVTEQSRSPRMVATPAHG